MIRHVGDVTTEPQDTRVFRRRTDRTDKNAQFGVS